MTLSKHMNMTFIFQINPVPHQKDILCTQILYISLPESHFDLNIGLKKYAQVRSSWL